MKMPNAAEGALLDLLLRHHGSIPVNAPVLKPYSKSAGCEALDRCHDARWIERRFLGDDGLQVYTVTPHGKAAAYLWRF